MTLAWQPDWLQESCIEDKLEELREADLCFHGIPKDERCPDCLDEAYDPDYGIDWGLPR